MGIGLSDTEASVTAPFTSCNKMISDVPILLKEGRCALETSFTAFKFMALYPIIQLVESSTLYQLGSVISSSQYLFDDIAIVLLLGIFMCWTKPAKSLSPARPPDDLFSSIVLASIIGQVVTCVVFFVVTVIMTKEQPWFCGVSEGTKNFDTGFKPITTGGNGTNPFTCYSFDPVKDVYNSNLARTHENTVIWLWTHFQFVWVALAFTITHHFRLPFWTNIPYKVYLSLITPVLSAMLLIPVNDSSSWLYQWFQIQVGVPVSFRVALFFLSILNLLICLGWEIVVVDKFLRERDLVRQTEQQDLLIAPRLNKNDGFGSSTDIEMGRLYRTDGP